MSRFWPTPRMNSWQRQPARLAMGSPYGHPYGWGASVGLMSAAAAMAAAETPVPSADVGYDACMRIALFSGSGDSRLSQRAIEHLAEAYVKIAEDYLAAHPEIPLILKSGVRYEYTPMVKTPDGRIVPARDRWQDVPTTYERKLGNCKEIATWRAAEQRRAGIAVRCKILHRIDPQTQRNIYHVVDEYPNGQIEDLCPQLGMIG